MYSVRVVRSPSDTARCRTAQAQPDSLPVELLGSHAAARTRLTTPNSSNTASVAISVSQRGQYRVCVLVRRGNWQPVTLQRTDWDQIPGTYDEIRAADFLRYFVFYAPYRVICRV